MSTAEELFGGKVAVVTGGGSGVGEGLVRHAASIGMKVVIADISLEGAERVRDDIVQAGGEAVAVAVDVRDPGQVDELAEQSYAAFGRVDLLVNNAGIQQFGYLWDTPLENWGRVVDINISGVFHGIRSFIPRMVASGHECYVWNLASVGAVTSIARQAPYLMSKHAVLGLTEALNLDIGLAGHNIRVSVVMPGNVASQIFHSGGAVEVGDVDAAEGARQDMLGILPAAMSPRAAAEAVFEQAAAGEFYLLTDPAFVGGVMRVRGEQLAARRTPVARIREQVAPASA